MYFTNSNSLQHWTDVVYYGSVVKGIEWDYCNTRIEIYSLIENTVFLFCFDVALTFLLDTLINETLSNSYIFL